MSTMTLDTPLSTLRTPEGVTADAFVDNADAAQKTDSTGAGESDAGESDAGKTDVDTRVNERADANGESLSDFEERIQQARQDAVPLRSKADSTSTETNTDDTATNSEPWRHEAPSHWPAPLKTLHALFELACGRPLPKSEGADARRMQLVSVGMLCSLAFAAIWGAAAGSMDATMAATNLVKVPLVVLLSVLGTLPASLLALRLANLRLRAVDFMVALSAGTFAGTLALGVLAPLVAVYYQTSAWAGPVLAIGSVGIALLTGISIFVRAVLARRPSGSRRLHFVIPILVQLSMLGLLMVQMISLASPILPELTFFDAGIDGLFR